MMYIQVSISYTPYIPLTLPPNDPSHAPAHPKNMLLKKTSNQPGIGGLSPGEIQMAGSLICAAEAAIYIATSVIFQR